MILLPVVCPAHNWVGMILLPVVCPAHNWDDLTAYSMSNTQLG